VRLDHSPSVRLSTQRQENLSTSRSAQLSCPECRRAAVHVVELRYPRKSISLDAGTGTKEYIVDECFEGIKKWFLYSY
jgi:hypothetical protein